MRGKVTAMIAPGGIGKSTLTNAMALSLATGRELLGKTVYDGPLRSWLWNLEDDGDSLARQRVAAAIHYDIKSAEH
jgi:RecA-family ATPase